MWNATSPAADGSVGVTGTTAPDSVMSSERISSFVMPAARPAAITSDIAKMAFFTGAVGSNGATKENVRRSAAAFLFGPATSIASPSLLVAEPRQHRAERRVVGVARIDPRGAGSRSRARRRCG